jgi:hypothetical protein
MVFVYSEVVFAMWFSLGGVIGVSWLFFIWC